MTLKDLVKHGGSLRPREKSKIEVVRERHNKAGRLDRIRELASEAGENNFPLSSDLLPDETQQSIGQEHAAFAAEVSRLAMQEISDCENRIRSLMFSDFALALAKADANQHAKEMQDTYGDDFKAADEKRAEAERALDRFEANHRLSKHSARYGRDTLMFGSSLLALATVEGTANAFFLQELSDSGLVGGFGIAFGAGAINTFAGLMAGNFSRLVTHRKTILKLLGLPATGLFLLVSFSLLLALADLREAVGHGRTTIDFHVLFNPGSWFAWSSLQPFIIFWLGVVIFLIAALKGRGGIFGIVAPYWGHATADKPFRDAEAAVRQAVENVKAASANAFDEVVREQRAGLGAMRKALEKIREIALDAETVEKSLRDSIDLNTAQCQTQISAYRETNRRVRQTEAPAYFAQIYPNFDEIKVPRLDLTTVRTLREQAEKKLLTNIEALAEFEGWALQQQGASLDSILKSLRAGRR